MRKAKGQSLVEFALVIPVFLAIMAGILDGTRLLFTFNELQEAAHAGARWGAINVGRSPWGNVAACGNYNMPTPNCSDYPPNGVSATVIGQVNSKLIAVNQGLTNVDIKYTPSMDTTTESGTTDGHFRMTQVTVTVSYTFIPVLGFGHVHIPLVGRAVAFHE